MSAMISLVVMLEIDQVPTSLTVFSFAQRKRVIFLEVFVGLTD